VNQASVAHQGGRSEEAMAWLEEALRHNPVGPEAFNERGEILWEGGRCEESLREFHRASQVSPEFHPAQLNRIELLIEEFLEHEAALEACDEMLSRPLEGPIEAEVYYLKAKALFYLDDMHGTLFLLRRAIQTQASVPVYRAFEGQVLFELGHFEEALQSLEHSRALDSESAHTLYHIGLCHEHLGDTERADEYFQSATELDCECYPRLERIEAEEFEAVAAEALGSLPETIRRFVHNCPILIEELPDRQMISEEDLSPQVLGLFLGVAATEPGASPTLGTEQRTDTDRIFLYRRNLEKVASSRSELVEQIQITVKHEIAHYLGLDEEEVDRLGLG